MSSKKDVSWGTAAPEDENLPAGKKISFALISFTGCNGCMSALMCDPIFLSMFQASVFTYFPLILDPPKAGLGEMPAPRAKKGKGQSRSTALKDGTTIKADIVADLNELEHVDIALVEGSIYTDEQAEIADVLRNKAKVIIAFGTCACSGGIASLAQETTHIDNKPLSSVIRVDDFIPGCPPTSKTIGNAILALTRGEAIEHSAKTLCDECPLKTDFSRENKFAITKLRPDPGNVPAQCFLPSGVMCLGPITRAGCGHRCINAGQPCDGCYGSVRGEFAANLANFLATMSVTWELKGYRGLFFKYSRPAGLLPQIEMKQEVKTKAGRRS